MMGMGIKLDPEMERVTSIEKGQVISLRITDVTEDGQAVGKTDGGMTVFTRGAVLGDKVQVKVRKLKKNFAVADLVTLTEPSPHRNDNFCPYDDHCGGCPFGKMGYGAQVGLKHRHVVDALTRIAGIERPAVRQPLGMSFPFGYRNKATVPVSMQTEYIPIEPGEDRRPRFRARKTDRPAIGFYRGKSHEVIDCESCRLQKPAVMKVMSVLREFMKTDHITAFDEKTGKGLLKSVTVRVAFATGEVMVVFGINGKGIPNHAKLIENIDDAINRLPRELDGTVYSLESVWTDNGKKKELLAGKRTITDRIGETSYEISPDAFFQVNPRMTEHLYNQVFAYAGLSEGDTVLDLYCGVGSIGLYLSGIMCDKITVVGIESNRSAVLDANRNAVINGIVNARYICGKAEEELPELLGKQEETASDKAEGGIADEDESGAVEQIRISKVDCVILDPPRAGCDGRLLEAAAETGSERIVYVSCEPATMARDIKKLCELGYEFIEATPVDMFPHTGHCEVTTLLKRL